MHSINESESLRYVRGNPVVQFDRWLPTCPTEGGLLLVDFALEQYWLPDPESLALTAIYCVNSNREVSISVTENALSCSRAVYLDQYAAWVREHQLAAVAVGEAIALAPRYINKPWGREIWFSGAEARGVCCVKTPEGETPIPWIQAAMPGGQFGNSGVPLILLKILDPVAEPVIGDLYFELHEEKREVYVVTNIDSGAWPDGTGYIRFGFAADKLSRYKDGGSFREAYLSAVRSYEKVRRELDGNLNPERGPIAKPGSELVDRERQLRREMDSFTNMKPLRVGDVVKVPLLTPHSLQHGVRTIEFQTPVYERKILSFGQKVLTQGHWDTEEAVARMKLERPEAEAFEVLCQGEGVLVERIVDFDDFEVRRVSLDAGQGMVDLPVEQYALVMVMDGFLQLSGALYGPEQALLLPGGWNASLLAAQPTAGLVFLLALPQKRAVES